MYTRNYKWYRHLKPINILGWFTGYGDCECGNSLRGKTGDYATSYHGGRVICWDCYKTFEGEIKRADHIIMSEPVREPSGIESYLICSDKSCFLHSGDGRFYWDAGYWRLRQDTE
jgi:hypothetical protein